MNPIKAMSSESAPIKLVCLSCGKAMDYEREIDPSIPVHVVKITQPHCDECWNGDREGETWLNADGREVAQTPPHEVDKASEPTHWQPLPAVPHMKRDLDFQFLVLMGLWVLILCAFGKRPNNQAMNFRSGAIIWLAWR